MSKLIAAIKSGRCFNGNEKDRGRIVHLVPAIAHYGDWFEKALCGAEAGLRGNGWSKTDKTVTCPECFKKIEARRNELMQIIEKTIDENQTLGADIIANAIIELDIIKAQVREKK